MKEAGEGLRGTDRFIENGFDITVDHFLTTPHCLLMNQVGMFTSSFSLFSNHIGQWEDQGFGHWPETNSKPWVGEHARCVVVGVC